MKRFLLLALALCIPSAAFGLEPLTPVPDPISTVGTTVVTMDRCADLLAYIACLDIEIQNQFTVLGEALAAWDAAIVVRDAAQADYYAACATGNYVTIAAAMAVYGAAITAADAAENAYNAEFNEFAMLYNMRAGYQAEYDADCDPLV